MTGGGSARGRLVRFGWEHRLRDDPTVVGLTQEVLFVVSSFADPDGTVTVTEKRIGRCVGKSERTVRRAMDEAREAGYLEQLSRGHHVHGRTPVASTYRLTTPDPPATPNVEHENHEGLRLVDEADSSRDVG